MLRTLHPAILLPRHFLQMHPQFLLTMADQTLPLTLVIRRQAWQEILQMLLCFFSGLTSMFFWNSAFSFVTMAPRRFGGFTAS